MWLKAPTNIELLSNQVHIWRENLDNAKPLLEEFTQILAEDELVRARRFHFELHRQRFIAARGILRSILGRYLNIEPSKIKFGYEAHGKPFLDGITEQQWNSSHCDVRKQSHNSDLLQVAKSSSESNFNNKNLNFNVSHSENFALYAIGLNNSIGVDLECINSKTDVVSLAQRFFSPREFAVIESAPQEQQQQLFFRYWTCKEAYLKATGTGLKDLQKVEISLTAEQPAELNIPNISGEWSLLEMQPFSDCVATVAFTGRDLQFKYWDY
ncbi:phosphopantetheine--protein transferase [Rivularia sp. PCC 7116]|uniref:4'-phosphopantetheinyl transferase family protein n=1 Tax=Rivularia sp. PCC 7116 TaxID=373994 RepID=UPI00029ED669|nr:4'-phosphopantetheinyl transferase superfamily protein [Rivularia sp. PCC 7116]AFY54564.1 phosphopantetheine--protein transferase [Rivularia sp. PCC 7116]